ncbi:unnamed protein product [Effrenium voratum]|uniref:Apple domain-containing protein n=1 Tax=Effrenium voratum TaxID=2562239 RepID=A0AA36IWG9_9DINO|nr:unnamed protein product [Effrenium voratum]
MRAMLWIIGALLPSAVALRPEMRINAGPSHCTVLDHQILFKRFRIGVKEGRPCQKEAEWNRHLVYENPDSPDVIALFVYPEDDQHALDFCERLLHGPLCPRLLSQSHHHSVHFHRVGSVLEAKKIVQALPSHTIIKTLVLGGYAGPGLHWARDAEVRALSAEDDDSDDFIYALLPFLIAQRVRFQHAPVTPTCGAAGSLASMASLVVFDICGEAEAEAGGAELMGHVAHRLLGTRIFTAGSSWCQAPGPAEALDEDLSRSLCRASKPWREWPMSEEISGAERSHWLFADRSFCQNWMASYSGTHFDLVENCRERCEKESRCRAFTFYAGSSKRGRHCYLSEDCMLSKSFKGGSVYVKTQ